MRTNTVKQCWHSLSYGSLTVGSLTNDGDYETKATVARLITLVYATRLRGAVGMQPVWEDNLIGPENAMQYI